jgi:uncharacterized protein (TIGR02145 family)
LPSCQKDESNQDSTVNLGNLPPTLLSKKEKLHGTVKDIDGNVYKTVKIGDHWYMAENLRTTRYNDGTPIPLVTGDAEWSDLTTPAFCWYNNDKKDEKTYGALYNWYVIRQVDENGISKVCPTGWAGIDWLAFTGVTYILGGEDVAGGKLKETGTKHWEFPNIGATNEVGFTALPGGRRLPDGTFENIGTDGYWWFTKIVRPGQVVSETINYNSAGIVREDLSENYGYSIRCFQWN